MWVVDTGDNDVYAYNAEPPTRVLTATDVGLTAATLNITWQSAAWWYKSATVDHTACTAVTSDFASVTVTGLSPGTSYAFSAYEDSACSAAKRLAAAGAFTTSDYGDRHDDPAEEFSLDSANSDPTGVWSNGTTAWVADVGDDKLFAYTLETGARDTSAEFGLHSDNGDPRGMWSDGTTVWVSDRDDDKLFAYTLATGARDTSKEFSLDSGNSNPWGVWSDGTTVWVSDRDDDKLFAYTLATGTRDTSKEFSLDSGNDQVRGIWSNGTTMWAVDQTDRKM